MSVIVAGQAQGNPIWLLSRGGLFMMPGAGANVALGPVYIPAGEVLLIQVSGGVPSTTVSGHLWGDISVVAGGNDLSTAPPQSSGTIPQFGQKILLGFITDPGGTQPSADFRLPTGAQSIRCAPDNSGAPQYIAVTGKTTGTLYLRIPTPNSYAYAAPVDPSIDAVVTVSFQGRAGGSQVCKVSATLGTDSVSIWAPPGEEIAMSLNDVGGNPIALGQDTFLNGGKSIPVVPAKFYTPAPAIAPNKAPLDFGLNLAAAASTTLIAGVAGQVIYLFDITIQNQVGVANQFGQFESPAATAVWQFGTGTAWGPITIHFSGAPLPVGAALVAHNTSAVNGFIPQGSITYSQA